MNKEIVDQLEHAALHKILKKVLKKRFCLGTRRWIRAYSELLQAAEFRHSIDKD